jgi:hypothetical protein
MAELLASAVVVAVAGAVFLVLCTRVARLELFFARRAHTGRASHARPITSIRTILSFLVAVVILDVEGLSALKASEISSTALPARVLITCEMLRGVFRSFKNNKILGSIVRPIPIDMMHNFVRLQHPAKALAHYKAMLSDVSLLQGKRVIGPTQINIAALVSDASANPVGVSAIRAGHTFPSLVFDTYIIPCVTRVCRLEVCYR